MLTNLNLTSGITKRDIGLLLVITLLVDTVLYFTKFSSLMITLYDLLLMVTFYVGIKLHRILREQDEVKRDRKGQFNQFVIIFLTFYCAISVIDSFSYSLFESYWEDHEQQVEYSNEIIESQVTELPPEEATVEDYTYHVFSVIDAVGYEFLSSILAGSEEIWRLGYMILILVVLKKMFRNKWDNGDKRPFVIVALIVSSFLFGWSHTFSSVYDQPSIYIGTVVLYTLAGFIFGVLLLWSKNLWLLVLAHSLYDVLVTISWYYFGLALEVTIVILLVIYAMNYALPSKKQKATVEV